MRLRGPSAARLIRRGLVVLPTPVVLVQSSLVLGLMTTTPARAERAMARQVAAAVATAADPRIV
jgi:hypothetical protein